MQQIAALYVQRDGCYYGLEGVDPWDEARDARLYAGPWPVVAHPPCARWCRMAPVNQARYGQRIGDDGGTFKAALSSVREWGGVLEHPAGTRAWAKYGLPRPQRGSWQRDMFGDGWVTEVSQSAYGHRARKATWLYAVLERPPVMDWSDPSGTDWVSYCDYDKYPDVPRIGKKEASATPIAFRDLLISIARSASRMSGDIIQFN